MVGEAADMSLASWLGLARDLAAILAIGAALLSLATFWSGQNGLSGGLAASVLIVSLAAVAALTMHGLLSGGAGLPGGAVAGIMAATVLAGAFFAAHVWGVRGLWVAGLALVGVAFAWALIWAFAGRLEAYAAGLGPVLALLLLSVLALGALGSVTWQAQRWQARQAQSPVGLGAGKEPAMLVAASQLLATPPPWFDCAYATLGGAAAAPGQCAFTPPKVETQPVWAAPAGAPDTRQAASGVALEDRASQSEETDAAAPPAFEARPAEPSEPAEPSLSNPEFDTAATATTTRPQSPSGLSRPRNPDAPADRGLDAETASAPLQGEPQSASVESAAPGDNQVAAAEAPQAAPTPPAGPPLSDGAAAETEGPAAAETAPPSVSTPADAIAAPNIGDGAPQQPNAPGGEQSPSALASAPPAAVIEPGETRAGPVGDALAAPLRSAADSNRPVSAFVCFPMTSLAADRLCPDQRFDVTDLGVRWRLPGGEAIDSPDGVECAVDRGIEMHATLFVNLSGDLAAAMPSDTATRMRKADSLYDAATRMIGGVRGTTDRGRADGAGATLMSLYVAGGSSLLSPWAEQSFSPDRSDRLFDVSSPGQALSLLRRLKTDTQAVRKNTAARDLGAELVAMAQDRPESAAANARSTVILVTDALAAEMLEREEAARIGAALAQAGLPVLAIEIGLAAPSPAMTALAESSGGSAFAASDGESLYRLMSRSLERSRRFCAVRVTAPNRFFDEGTLELRLRRRMTDGCALQQVATISCDGLNFSERVETDLK